MQRHNHLGVVDFDERTVYLTGGNQVFRLKLAIANLTNGVKVAYAKGLIEETNSEISRQIKEAETTWKSQSESTSDNSIYQSIKKKSRKIFREKLRPWKFDHSR